MFRGLPQVFDHSDVVPRRSTIEASSRQTSPFRRDEPSRLNSTNACCPLSAASVIQTGTENHRCRRQSELRARVQRQHPICLSGIGGEILVNQI